MSNKSRSGFSASTRESLCCEYRNIHGEKSHLLAISCDCEALGETFDKETFDKIFKCERVSTIDSLLNTISDRCRLPTCFGHSVAKLRPDVVTPALVVPLCLVLATIHPIMTVLCFLFMPLFIVTFHALWRRKDKTRRSLFFYSWGVSSVISEYLVFQFFVVVFREALLLEILTVFTSVMIMFYFLHQTKRNPDLLIISSKTRPSHKQAPSNQGVADSTPFYDQINCVDMQQKLHGGDSSHMSLDGAGDGLSEAWMESRTLAGKLDLSPRMVYCRICQEYIAVRDHHCVWIDSCVGASNHHSFLLAMILFILTGIYSVHLTLTTVCTPKMYLHWFLLPNDCRWLYDDFLTTICFVTAVYNAITVSLMCLGLVYQTLLISQNLTSHELSQTQRQGMTTCAFFLRKNPHNKGFLRNWLAF